jgi:hypothetical protein
MIKLKSLITEQDISEYSSITQALQTAIDNFTKTSLSTAGEGNLWIPKITTDGITSGGSKDFPYLFVTYTWNILLTNPKTGSTVSQSNVGHSTPYWLGRLTVKRRGAAKDKGDVIWLKQFQMNGASSMLAKDATIETVCNYNANNGSTSKWSSTDKYIANAYNGFKKIAGEFAGDETIANPLRKTADAIMMNGKKLISDFKAAFNSIEIVPITPEGKKIWKGMKSV